MAARAAVADNQTNETSRALTTDECQNRNDVIFQTREIYFASGSASIDQTESAPVFDAVAQFFNRCPSVSMVIAGHTKSDGSAACNQDLSARRADAVA
jgi:OmpA-OmpF porin, OOP family